MDNRKMAIVGADASQYMSATLLAMGLASLGGMKMPREPELIRYKTLPVPLHDKPRKLKRRKKGNHFAFN